MVEIFLRTVVEIYEGGNPKAADASWLLHEAASVTLAQVCAARDRANPQAPASAEETGDA